MCSYGVVSQLLEGGTPYACQPIFFCPETWASVIKRLYYMHLSSACYIFLRLMVLNFDLVTSSHPVWGLACLHLSNETGSWEIDFCWSNSSKQMVLNALGNKSFLMEVGDHDNDVTVVGTLALSDVWGPPNLELERGKNCLSSFDMSKIWMSNISLAWYNLWEINHSMNEDLETWAYTAWKVRYHRLVNARLWWWIERWMKGKLNGAAIRVVLWDLGKAFRCRNRVPSLQLVVYSFLLVNFGWKNLPSGCSTFVPCKWLLRGSVVNWAFTPLHDGFYGNKLFGGNQVYTN